MNKNYSPIGRDIYFHKQVSNIQIELYMMRLICFSGFIYWFLFYEYLEIVNHATIVKIIHIVIVILTKHPAPPMIIEDHNRYHIINVHLLMNVKSIAMIEMHKNFHPIMCMIGKNWISKVTFIVEYKPPTKNMFQ